MGSWLFQANPKFYNARQALQHFKATSHPTTWLVNAHKDRIKAGDEVFFWEAGPQAGLVGWGTIQTDPVKMPLEQEELQFVLVKAKFEGSRLRVRIKVDGYCFRRKVPGLGEWRPVARGVEGTNFHIPPAIRDQLQLAAKSSE